MRTNELRRHHAEALLARADNEPPENALLTELHTTNVNVDRINEERLVTLAGDELIYQQHTTGSANYVENLQRSVLAAVRRTTELGGK